MNESILFKFPVMLYRLLQQNEVEPEHGANLLTKNERKIKMQSFTHQDLWLSLSLEHKRRYLKECW